MTTEAQEAQDRCWKTLQIYSKALVRLAFGVDSTQQAQAIANAALYESAELNKEPEPSRAQ